LLDGLVDIYMPDMKYGDEKLAREYSHVGDYVCVNQAAVREMHRQVCDLVINAEGLAPRGLLVRQLVLRTDVSGVEALLKFLAKEVSANTCLNLTGQYRPCYRAGEHPALDRPEHARRVLSGIDACRRCVLCRIDPDSFRYKTHSLACKGVMS
jgi:putative pyruvate formate lyase activating enzyme